MIKCRQFDIIGVVVSGTVKVGRMKRETHVSRADISSKKLRFFSGMLAELAYRKFASDGEKPVRSRRREKGAAPMWPINSATVTERIALGKAGVSDDIQAGRPATRLY